MPRRNESAIGRPAQRRVVMNAGTAAPNHVPVRHSVLAPNAYHRGENVTITRREVKEAFEIENDN